MLAACQRCKALPAHAFVSKLGPPEQMLHKGAGFLLLLLQRLHSGTERGQVLRPSGCGCCSAISPCVPLLLVQHSPQARRMLPARPAFLDCRKADEADVPQDAQPKVIAERLADLDAVPHSAVRNVVGLDCTKGQDISSAHDTGCHGKGTVVTTLGTGLHACKRCWRQCMGPARKVPPFPKQVCAHVRKGPRQVLALEGRLIRKPSEVGSSVKPWPMVASGGSCSVVCSVLPMSWNSGSSHCAGFGMTMPTLGKLPKYRSARHSRAVQIAVVASLHKCSWFRSAPPALPPETGKLCITEEWGPCLCRS